MRITITASLRAAHQCEHADAMERGLRAHGYSVRRAFCGSSTPDPIVCCWGWRVGRGYYEQGKRVLVMERGYIGDRFRWTSLAWNGLNGAGTAPAPPDDDGARLERHHPGVLKPWREIRETDGILIAGQVPGDASLRGRNLYAAWYQEQAAEATRRWPGRAVWFRPHPLGAKRGAPQAIPGAVTATGDLSDMLDRTALVVTYNSNTGVDAVLSGIPVVACGPGSMASSVASGCMPDALPVEEPELRRMWAQRLAWRQWSMKEIESGAAVEHLFSELPQ